MSSTLENGDVRHHAVKDDSHLAILQNETSMDDLIENDEEELEQDVDTIPELDTTRAAFVPATDDTDQTADEAPLITATEPDLSADDASSVPDDSPSIQGSVVSSPSREIQRPSLAISRNNSTASRRPFELRFQSRLSSSYLGTPRASSPAFLTAHSRNSSLASFARDSESGVEESNTPWEVIRWSRWRRLAGQAFSEVGRRNFGSPTCLIVADQIVIGTSKGLVLIFDHHQNNKNIIGAGTKAIEAGPVSSLAISADYSAIAVGHATGNIFTWEISRPGRPFLTIPAIDGSAAAARKNDGHLQGCSVLHIGFLGYRRTALVSADDKGMAFSHLATRGAGALGRSVRTTRILGRYPELIVRQGVKPIKRSSVLAFSPLPLGNVEQSTDGSGLVAMLTPYLLVVVSTTPIAQTQLKLPRPKDIAAHSTMTGALAWFPAIKLKGNETVISRNKLAYVWSNVLHVLEVVEIPKEPDTPEEKPVELQFNTRSKHQAEEAIVAVQWLSRSVMAVLTITQQLLIVEDGTMVVTDSFDLLPKNVYHADVYSHQLQAVVESLEEEDSSMHGVVADAYYMSFRAYKGRLFLLGANDIWSGSLTNWADRLIALMESGDYIAAIRLATNYFAGVGEKATIGLPEGNTARSSLVREKLVEMIMASLRYAFGKNEQADSTIRDRRHLTELAVACVAACLRMDDKDLLFDEVFESYDDFGYGDIVMDVLEPHILDRHITSLPPAAVKVLINHFSTTHPPSQLEEIICLLDATEMDVDQVTTLCKRYNLYDAYVYVWNTALMDYVTPMLDLLAFAAPNHLTNGHSGHDHTFIAQKIFPYLSFALTGRVYPLGEFMTDDRALIAKGQLYETLFYGQKNHDRPAATLKNILHFDTANFMAAMNEAFEDPFLNTGQDDELNDSDPNTSRGTSMDRQAIVLSLLNVMADGFDVQDTIYLDMFIARNLPKYPQYMLLSGTIMDQIFGRLCQYDHEDLRDEAELSVEYLMAVYKPSNLASWIPALENAKFWKVLKAVFRLENEWTALLNLTIAHSENDREPFTVIEDCLRGGSELDSIQRQKFVNAVKTNAVNLCWIDVVMTAKSIDKHILEEHSYVIQELDSDPRLQYLYLQVLFEPPKGRDVSANINTGMQERYIRLMCQYEPSHVTEYVSQMPSSDLLIEDLMPALEESGNIDAAVMLMAKQGLIQQSMERLVSHLSVVENALSSVLESAIDSPDEVATNETIEHLIDTIDKDAKVGIWLCENQSRKTSAGHQAPGLARRSSEHQLRGFDENLWLDFITAIIGVVQNVGHCPIQPPDTPHEDEILTSLRGIVQRVFTSLLNSTTTSGNVGSNADPLKFVRILRAFLSRIVETSPTLSHLRHVMASIFSAHAYEESLLTLSNAMIERDLFGQLKKVTASRQIGWRPRGQICGICRLRTWGPGTGLTIWQEWQRKENERSKHKVHRRRSLVSLSMAENDEDYESVVSKGKSVAAQSQSEDSEDEQQHLERDKDKSSMALKESSVVVFSCRHLFHHECLRRNKESEPLAVLDVDDGQLFNDHLVCPICPRGFNTER